MLSMIKDVEMENDGQRASTAAETVESLDHRGVSVTKAMLPVQAWARESTKGDSGQGSGQTTLSPASRDEDHAHIANGVYILDEREGYVRNGVTTSVGTLEMAAVSTSLSRLLYKKLLPNLRVSDV